MPCKMHIHQIFCYSLAKANLCTMKLRISLFPLKLFEWLNYIIFLYYLWCKSIIYTKERDARNFKANLKKLFISYPPAGWNTKQPPTGGNFFLQSLCLKRYTTKRFKKIGSWYSKNFTLYVFIFNSYVQFLCWFIVIC